jgi:hypothetical protein
VVCTLYARRDYAVSTVYGRQGECIGRGGVGDHSWSSYAMVRRSICFGDGGGETGTFSCSANTTAYGIGDGDLDALRKDAGDPGSGFKTQDEDGGGETGTFSCLADMTGD